MTGPLLIGVGNPYRGDDGAGLAVLAALGHGTESTGDPADLLTLWAKADRVLLVDAVGTGARPGTVHLLSCRDGRWDVAPPPHASTHGLGVAEAVALGAVLGNVPADLLLIGIEVSDCGYGERLSAPVAAAVPRAAALVRSLIGAAPTPAAPSARRRPL